MWGSDCTVLYWWDNSQTTGNFVCTVSALSVLKLWQLCCCTASRDAHSGNVLVLYKYHSINSSLLWPLCTILPSIMKNFPSSFIMWYKYSSFENVYDNQQKHCLLYYRMHFSNFKVWIVPYNSINHFDLTSLYCWLMTQTWEMWKEIMLSLNKFSLSQLWIMYKNTLTACQSKCIFLFDY